jgi:hypothetical protein
VFVLLEFHVHRASIERELCVQRDMVEAMRTCHGECQLTKRFRALEQEADAGFPVERIQVRFEPQIPLGGISHRVILTAFDRRFPALDEAPLGRTLTRDEPVPRG